MAHRSRPTTNKRAREQARIAKRNDKAARLAERRATERPDVPEGVDPDKVDAKFAKGVLTIMLPKKPEVVKAAKKIEVKPA